MKNMLLAMFATAALSTAAIAHHAGEQFRAGDIAVSHAYTFENAEMAHAMRVYVTVHNTGDTADKLIGASVSFADEVAFEAQVIDASGSLVTNTLTSITVQPGQSLTMQPGSVWIELDSVQSTFKHGQHFDMALTFERAGTVTIEVEVEESEHGDDHDHDHTKADS
ncbi:copper chaperone PCu(A)C [Acuticoccus sp. M5D2P5]|uniref:copper chaperone PCu(A)C n=1 Tax=Acuticoccus kalidii TaxID=2910977 RepID=UPI001F28B33B|nr:copper chaperone PCu(A)C [Acuticoccus kalidii]MCF3933264.1 copper chaperone PCu(A)C [Acuticoccus kalidii]